MKAYPKATVLPVFNTIKIAVFATIFTLISFFGYSQELVFKNAKLEPGSPAAGTDGAVYRFPKVTSKGDVDALVTIIGRYANNGNSGKVVLKSIDYTASGYDVAFQPQVIFNDGETPKGNSNWYMEFDITFVQNGKNIPVAVETADVTALDIDGNDESLQESVTLYALSTYVVANNTRLTVSKVTHTLSGFTAPVEGIKFLGTAMDYPGINTSSQRVRATVTYKNSRRIRFRAGGESGSRQSTSDRLYSLYFKSFTYDDPNEGSLPVKLYSFTATKKNDNKVALDWTTSQELNTSHFVIERSYDGKNYEDAGIVFAVGNSNVNNNYKFTDEPKSKSGVVYYRLKMVDVDQYAERSAIRVIRTSEISGEAKILTYPNPVVNELRVQLPVSWQQKQVNIEVYNSNGQIVKRSSVSRANQNETVGVSELSSGVYIVKASNGTEVATQRIVKTK